MSDKSRAFADIRDAITDHYLCRAPSYNEMQNAMGFVKRAAALAYEQAALAYEQAALTSLAAAKWAGPGETDGSPEFDAGATAGWARCCEHVAREIRNLGKVK